VRATNGQTGPQTALDRVASGLSSEAARTELYRYASNVAEQMPPDASSWYVVGAVMQVNAVTRSELTTLAKEAKRGGTILAGFYEVAARLPTIAGVSLLTAAVTVLLTAVVASVFWHAATTPAGAARKAASLPPNSSCAVRGSPRCAMSSWRIATATAPTSRTSCSCNAAALLRAVSQDPRASASARHPDGR